MNRTFYYIVVADCGGGSDGNPFSDLELAKADIEGEDGTEIWKIKTDQYEAYANGEVDISDLGVLVWEQR